MRIEWLRAGRERPLRDDTLSQDDRMPHRRWALFALVLTVVCLCAQERGTQTLTVPAYHNLPTTEGYFQGAGGVRLFYKW